MRLGSLRNRLLVVAALLAMAVTGTRFAVAQEPGGRQGRGPSLEEIVVTAQRREEGLQDIGASVTSLGSEQLDKSGLGTGREIANLTSGVLLNDNFGNQPVFVIRGIGVNDFEPITSPSAAVYIDDVFRANSISAAPLMFDQERVEILKGPQGTLYGRNSSSGAINFISRRPTADLEAYLKAGYGRFDRIDVETAFSGPLTDTLSGRISGRHLSYGDTLFDNRSPDPVNFPVQGEDVFAPSDWGIRGQLLWEPADPTEVLMRVYYSDSSGTTSNAKAIPISQDPTSAATCSGRGGSAEDREGCIAGFNGSGFNGGGLVVPLTDDFTVSTNFSEPLDAEFYGVSLYIEHEYGWGTITSISAYDGYDYFRNWDEDATPINSLHIRHDFDYHLVSQELRLAGNNEFVDWIVGVYASEDVFGDEGLLYNGSLLDDGIRGSLDYVGAPGRVDPASPRFDTAIGNANSIITSGEQTTRSYAAFTDNQIALTESVTLIAGYRFTYERRFWDASGFIAFNDGGIELANQNGIGIADGTAVKVANRSTGRIGINWQPADTILSYISFSEGFKSGGFDGGVASNAAILFAGYEPESVRQIEVGVKSDPLPNLRFNAAVFRSEYDQPQARLRRDTLAADGVTVVPVTTLGNLDEATILGAEVEASWAPVDGLVLNATLSALDSEISQGGEPAETFNGNELPFAPSISWTVAGEYEWNLTGDLRASIGVNAKYVGDHYLRPENFPIDIESYTVVDARISVGAANERWLLSLWGKNLTDEEYRTNAVGSFGADAFALGTPMQWGISVTLRH